MSYQPYTTADEDPFNIQPLLRQPRRRRSSMLNRWIQDQNQQPVASSCDVPDFTTYAADIPPSRTRPYAYLAYPDLGRFVPEPEDEVDTLNSFDLVDDDDIPQTVEDCALTETPKTPTTTRSRRTSRILHTPSSFRSFHLSFISSSPVPSLSVSPTPPHSPSRLSLFPLGSRPSSSSGRQTTKQHYRSSSLPTLDIPMESTSPHISATGASKWRPSVLGHFASTANSKTSIPPSDALYSPSRPSMSSSNTNTSATAITADSEMPLTPPRFSFIGSIRSRSRSQGSVFRSASATASSSSLRSHPASTCPSYSNLNDVPPSTCPSSFTLSHKPNTTRVPFTPKLKSRLSNTNIDDTENDDDVDCCAQSIVCDTTRPHVAYSSGKGRASRVSFGSLGARNQKKRKLVISGIGSNEVRKFEGVKRWCESFGEVSEIMRMPNGDLHVHFRRADVAETVCRLRAKVYISGVGSVQLSWYTGTKQ